ncbi:hypothetical protein SPHINGO391_460009 [Sphingomonas aurantiaca]|uniref:Uncharacterized protein n=1 Tax=Sphingomonas aurantiaca TaxID=185949 RepID=A0A5E7ZHE3_9SPHN|nr:hypothetical protein SPHINGO391_460009 [Sphingomonas aurantiaca]
MAHRGCVAARGRRLKRMQLRVQSEVARGSRACVAVVRAFPAYRRPVGGVSAVRGAARCGARDGGGRLS